MIVLKYNKLWMLFFIACIPFGLIIFISQYNNNETSLWIFILNMIILTICALYAWVLIPFMRICFDSKGFYFYNPLNNFIKPTQHHTFLSIDGVRHVRSLFLPLWFPLKAISIEGVCDNNKTGTAIGNMMTNFKAAVLFIGDNVSSNVIDEDVMELIVKYRGEENQK